MFELFDFELKENTEPEDNTRITLVNLYFSSTEKARFNELCKKGMMEFYGPDARKANAVDFMLDLLERQFGSDQRLPQQLPLEFDTTKIFNALENAKSEITKIEELINGKNHREKAAV